jgi:hypothetical protein
MEELLEAPDPGKQTGYLTEASIYSGTVSIDDRHAGNVWKAEDLEVHLARGDRGVAGSFRLKVPQFGDPAQLSAMCCCPGRRPVRDRRQAAALFRCLDRADRNRSFDSRQRRRVLEGDAHTTSRAPASWAPRSSRLPAAMARSRCRT